MRRRIDDVPVPAGWAAARTRARTPIAGPLAVAIGNASLLGIGYWLLRRRGLAVGAALITAVLVGLLAGASTDIATGLEVAVVVEQSGAIENRCPYENTLLPDFPTTVNFHKIAVAVKAYALRTGRLGLNTTVQVGGGSCPDPVPYSESLDLPDMGPPTDVYVHASAADVQAAFARVFTR